MDPEHCFIEKNISPNSKPINLQGVQRYFVLGFYRGVSLQPASSMIRQAKALC